MTKEKEDQKFEHVSKFNTPKTTDILMLSLRKIHVKIKKHHPYVRHLVWEDNAEKSEPDDDHDDDDDDDAWDVSGFVRLFYILSKNKIFRILTKIFIILRPKQSILNKYLVNLY